MSDAQALRVRDARADDAESIARVHVTAWRETYAGVLAEEYFSDAAVQRRLRFWSGHLALKPRPGRTAVAERGGAVVGFASAGPARGPDAEHGYRPARALHLFSIYLLSAAQGIGLGQQLLDRVLGSAPAQLWVLRGNDRAVAFYRRNGFAADGIEFTDPDDPRLVEDRMVR